MASSALISPPKIDAAILDRIPPGAVTRPEREAALAAAEQPMNPSVVNKFWRVDFARLDLQIGAPRALATPEYSVPETASMLGVVFCSLAQAAQSHAALVKRVLGKIVPTHESRFTALASALEQGGYFLYVPAGVRIAEPLVAKITVNAGELWSPRCLIIVEAGASVRLNEHISGSPGRTEHPALVCGVVEAMIADNAELSVVTQQVLDSGAQIFMTRRAAVEHNAKVRWAVAELGAALVQSRLDSRLNGENADSDCAAVFFPHATQHVDLKTEVVHAVPDTTSQTTVKAAGKERGQGRFEGNIKIVPGAHGSAARLRDDSLLLSPDAHVDTIPALEIAANDVQAFHGATVGAIDKETRFYLMSRGIPAEEADRMITLAFFEGALEHISDEAQREQITQQLAERVGRE